MRSSRRSALRIRRRGSRRWRELHSLNRAFISMRSVIIVLFVVSLSLSGCIVASTSCPPVMPTAIPVSDTSSFKLVPEIDSVQILILPLENTDTTNLLNIVEDPSLTDSCRVITSGVSVNGDLHYHDTASIMGRTLVIQVEAGISVSAAIGGKGNRILCTPIPAHIETSSIRFVKPASRKLVVSIN